MACYLFSTDWTANADLGGFRSFDADALTSWTCSTRPESLVITSPAVHSFAALRRDVFRSENARVARRILAALTR